MFILLLIIVIIISFTNFWFFKPMCWNSNTLATSCEQLTHWKRFWCWEGLGAGGEGNDWGLDGWMASLTRWTWVWVNSGSWWWTGRPGVLQFMGLRRVRHNWATELKWTDSFVDAVKEYNLILDIILYLYNLSYPFCY